MLSLVRRLPSTFARVVASEWLPSAAGALIGIAATGALTALLAGQSGLPILMAPLGASAVLLFAVPASPLARPWAVIGGNCLSALVGIAIAMSVSSTVVAAGLAVGGAIAAMSLLRCLHPPGGACALTAVLLAPQTIGDGLFLVLLPLLVNSVLLVIAAMICNRALGRTYPHRAHPAPQPLESPDKALTEADFDVVLADYGEVLDISRTDLQMLYLELKKRAEDKRANPPKRLIRP